MFCFTVALLFPQVFGTGVLVFLGCMGVVQGLGQPGDHTGVVLSFALAVFVAIQVIFKKYIELSVPCWLTSDSTYINLTFQICCHNSGGHVNPAVTVVSLFFKKLNLPMAGIYIAGQVVGGILGFGLLKVGGCAGRDREARCKTWRECCSSSRQTVCCTSDTRSMDFARLLYILT